MLKTPPLQTATATIDTLCGRLESATLLEDRRAAILGLRSFAKQYPASVASGSLRELISTLKRDGLGESSPTKSQDSESRKSQEGGDVDTIRLVLETLLMLFNPDSNSPEAGDEIAFFLADDPYADYYSRLYSVQILSSICAARPDRLQECILSAPLGISRLVGVLDDGRDAVRNAGLLLLVDLTSGANEDLRKIVAFEDVFGKIFALIRLEGGLAEAGITAQDCLSLLANLIRGSASNQTMFRESGCVAQLTKLLAEAFPPEDSEAPYVAQSREKAAWGLVQLLRLFFSPGETSTPQNQTAFFRAGTAQVLIDLGFTGSLPSPIRTSALKAAAALIESNPPLQEQFAALTVITPADAEHNAEQAQKPQQVNGTRPKSAAGNRASARASVENRRTYIIEALLDMCLGQSQSEPSLRAASCGLIQAYLTNHERIRAHFLQRAVAGHAEKETAANVITALLHPTENDSSSVVFASWIIQDLAADNLDAKSTLLAVKEGNENEGEDVVTAVQAFGSQLQASLQTPIDERLAASYASLLSTLLWDFAPGVDDLLEDGSSLMQTLVGLVKAPSDPVVTGLSAVLLGTVYEFSTKDSPIPRRTLAPLLQQKLGRTKYLDALLQLRRQPAIRDFDLDLESDENDALLSRVYVELFAVEYSRLRKAVDKDPGVEVLPPSAAEAGVDRDVLDDLRQQLQSAKDALAQAQQEALEAGQKGEQDKMAAHKELQTSISETERLRKINQAMQQGHEAELEKQQKQFEQQRQTSDTRHQHALADARRDAERKGQETLRERETASTTKMQEYERRIAELGNSHRTEASGHANARQQLEALTAKHNEIITRERDLARQLQDLQQQYATAEKGLQTATERATAAESKLNIAKTALDTRGEEVDQLKSQVSELKEELKTRDEELKTERSGFADLEKELEGAKADNKAEKEKLDKLEKEVEEAKQGEKSAKDELESMLLVMGDIEAKRDEYKAKIKELGGDVTDDDEDEDEDEEDEDGEDDVD
ncbi:hypothetical protein M409DRAFT_68268 [Zasmidium cellare ATCC 36951]|uniref:Vesicle tethering protein Uso1/P115-like head domain-containing protein n=1 Tax=Zasmidium cellare ATCC 36951 TaxID=1080233 RepID=A0A6A6C9D5_ZASCE|nr:uncharacterized protein M409DRAFT_68268 [Zasmidium cellare ATCC 36951]KAF2163651.1 hypothetical protein M409DRAFT_68268 [Zasmidium cellare ATCC 36951]